MPPTIWIDGQYRDGASATVSVYDHGLLYGDGVFEGIRAYKRRVFRLQQHLDRLSPRIKSLNYLAHILAKVEGIAAGVDEVLMLDPGGYVAEASGMNLFVVMNGTIRTLPAYIGILKGITRDAVIELARDANYAVEELPLNRYDLYTADEVFLTGTAAEIVGVSKLDARTIGKGVPGPVTRDLSKRFKALGT